MSLGERRGTGVYDMDFQKVVYSASGLVAIRDFGTEFNPSEELMEGVYFTPGHLLVSGRGDTEGGVAVQISIGDGDPPRTPKIFERGMNFLSGVVSVSAPEAPDEESLRLPQAGMWRVGVYAAGFPESSAIHLKFGRISE